MFGRIIEKVEKYIEEQRAIYIPQIEEIKKELKSLLMRTKKGIRKLA